MSIDYDTLVSRLRSEAHECGLLDEAADAIEALRAAIKPVARMASHALQGMYSAIADEERLGLGWSDDSRDDVPMLTAAEAYLIAQLADQEDAA